MKTIIAGTRHAGEYLFLKAIENCPFKDEITEVVSGGCQGPDQCGEAWALKKRLTVTLFPADWAKHGRAAGPIRNRQMAEYADALLLIWDGESRGSRNMLAEAKKCGLKIYIYEY